MSWMGGGDTYAEDTVATGLLTNIRFDPKDPDSYFNWHETRGIRRDTLEALYRDPKSRVGDLERLYRKAGINIQDLKDLLDEAADSTTLAAVFKANKKAYSVKPKSRRVLRMLKAFFGLAALIAATALIVLPFVSSCE